MVSNERTLASIWRYEALDLYSHPNIYTITHSYTRSILALTTNLHASKQNYWLSFGIHFHIFNCLVASRSVFREQHLPSSIPNTHTQHTSVSKEWNASNDENFRWLWIHINRQIQPIICAWQCLHHVHMCFWCNLELTFFFSVILENVDTLFLYVFSNANAGNSEFIRRGRFVEWIICNLFKTAYFDGWIRIRLHSK